MSATIDLKHEEVMAMLRELRALVAAGPKRWLSPEEAAHHLGVAPASVYRYIRNGSIPCHRLPGSNLIRFCVDELDAWVISGPDRTQGISTNEIRRLLK